MTNSRILLHKDYYTQYNQCNINHIQYFHRESPIYSYGNQRLITLYIYTNFFHHIRRFIGIFKGKKQDHSGLLFDSRLAPTQLLIGYS